MTKKRKLTDDEIHDLQIAFQTEPMLTIRDIAFKYHLSLETVRIYLKLKLKIEMGS